LPPPAAIVVDVPDEPVLYVAASDAALAARAQESGTALGRGASLLGFTTNAYDRRIAVEVAGDGDGCARLRSLRVTIAATIEVLIDRRFAEGTCQRQAILAHENEHVAVFREAAAHYAPLIAAALRARLGEIRAATTQQARDTYMRNVDASLRPWLDAIRWRAQDGNDRLDTPQSYARVFRQCPSW
jgi:hypothetical protein